MPVLIQCGFEKQTVQYMEPRNTPEINENQIYSDQITFSFVTVSLDHPVVGPKFSALLFLIATAFVNSAAMS